VKGQFLSCEEKREGRRTVLTARYGSCGGGVCRKRCGKQLLLFQGAQSSGGRGAMDAKRWMEIKEEVIEFLP